MAATDGRTDGRTGAGGRTPRNSSPGRSRSRQINPTIKRKDGRERLILRVIARWRNRYFGANLFHGMVGWRASFDAVKEVTDRDAWQITVLVLRMAHRIWKETKQ